MITIAWYLLKVIICSGILFGYYFFALRDKKFHRWNRFFLLASVVISLIMPLLKINILQKANSDNGTVIQMLQTINYSDEVVIEYSRNGFHLNSQLFAMFTYLFISVILLAVFLIALNKIRRLKKKFPETEIEGISFIATNARETPFSFFNSIFWNNAIDLHSKAGQQIFNHEIAHVKEKHSYDKIFMNVVMIFFWINPFFWLVRKELYMIHEFIADQQALEDSDTKAFAEMILQTVYPGQNFSITNNFFYSPLKRRLLMLTKNKNPKVSYLSRLLVLPLAAIIFFAFTLKVKKASPTLLYDGKTITVVVDAGHGGADDGAISSDGLKEKDIALSIAKKIKTLNTNEHIKISLSRDNDENIPLNDRVEFAKSIGPDIFISIHVNADTKDQSANGFSVVIDRANRNELLASALINELKKSYKTEAKILARNGNILVLDKNPFPAALIECGYITDAGDEAFITNNANQEKIAKNILDAINIYGAAEKISNVASSTITSTANYDTIPEMFYRGKKVTQLDVVPVTPKVIVTYKDGTKETISMGEAKKRGFIVPPPPPPKAPPAPPMPPVPAIDAPAPPPPPPPLPKDAVYILDGKPVSIAQVKKVKPEKIESINVLKGDIAVQKYGEEGRKGVIEITKKTENNRDGSTISATETTTSKPLYLVDGKEISAKEMKSISPATIESLNVLKDESAIQKYGAKGKSGVIEITTTLNSDSKKDSIPQ